MMTVIVMIIASILLGFMLGRMTRVKPGLMRRGSDRLAIDKRLEALR